MVHNLFLRNETAHTSALIFSVSRRLGRVQKTDRTKPQSAAQTAQRSVTEGYESGWQRFTHADEVHGWLDNLHLRYENKVALHGKRLKKTCLPGCAKFTLAVAKSDNTMQPRRRGRPTKIIVNRLKPFLGQFTLPREALKFLPMFDDIVTGAVRLDMGGNTRPLSKTMMVSLLQILDVVSTEAVQSTKLYSKRHAQRVCQCLRIIESMAFNVAAEHWHTSNEIYWPDVE
jgi:hypothetical protein